MTACEYASPSRKLTLGAFFLKRSMRAGPTGAAPTMMYSRDSKWAGVTSGLMAHQPTRGGAKCSNEGYEQIKKNIYIVCTITEVKHLECNQF